MAPQADAFDDIAAVIIEPYQAAGGMASPCGEYWKWLRDYTRERGILIIFDEIQTGFGKTGSFFAYEETGIVPDILLAGKGMSNGFGLGALLLSKAVGASIKPYKIAGGSADNDLMRSIVNLVFDIFEKEKIVNHAREMGGLFVNLLKDALSAHGIEGSFCGKGLFFSLELPEGLALTLAVELRNRGIRVGRMENMMIFRPPLVITEEDVRLVCGAVKTILSEMK